MNKHKPTKEDLADAVNRKVSDVIKPNLLILFVGINPSIYTAAVGFHFAHPSNRFWKALHDSGLTPRLLSPFENKQLLNYGFGITNLAERPTLKSEELSKKELLRGWKQLEQKVKKFHPKWVAICGLSAYRKLFGTKHSLGEQKETINETRIWLLPSPSGISASFTQKKLAQVFSELKNKIND